VKTVARAGSFLLFTGLALFTVNIVRMLIEDPDRAPKP
jgi:hypothetical protein